VPAFAQIRRTTVPVSVSYTDSLISMNMDLNTRGLPVINDQSEYYKKERKKIADALYVAAKAVPKNCPELNDTEITVNGLKINDMPFMMALNAVAKAGESLVEAAKKAKEDIDRKATEAKKKADEAATRLREQVITEPAQEAERVIRCVFGC
jgi:hypothetical protein